MLRVGVVRQAPASTVVVEPVAVDHGHPFEQPPHGRLGDLEIGVVGVRAAAVRGEQQAGAQTGR